jgi:diguanylate cyclase
VASQQDIDVLEKQLQQLQLEQETDQAELVALNRVAQRLCLAAKGLDRELDSRLESFQELLKGSSSGSLQTRAESTEKALMSYFHRRDLLVQQTLDALRTILTELWGKADSEQLKGELDLQLQELPEIVENYGDYPRLLTDTARILKQLCHQLGSADSSAADSGRDEQLRQLSGQLLELLDQLSSSTVQRDAARKLISIIEQGIDWPQLPGLLGQTVELVLKAMVVRQEDFEDYISGLNDQLSNIQGFISEDQGDRQARVDSFEQLDNIVRADVTKVETSLQRADSLDQLKGSVRSQLTDILMAMDNYRADQSQREQKVEARLVQLQQKLESMEQQAQQMQAHLEEQRLRATSDPLTTLPNRTAYNDRVEQELSRYQRYRNDLALVVCDIDKFKSINDSYGHLAGDKVLRLVAKHLSRRLREADFIARYGGEEFVILMPQTPLQQAKEVAEALREGIASSPFNFGGKPVQITVSFGLTQFLPGDQGHERVFERADAALYQAKRQGRNRCVVAQTS